MILLAQPLLNLTERFSKDGPKQSNGPSHQAGAQAGKGQHGDEEGPQRLSPAELVDTLDRHHLQYENIQTSQNTDQPETKADKWDGAE